jgi:hypothetical protein
MVVQVALAVVRPELGFVAGGALLAFWNRFQKCS